MADIADKANDTAEQNLNRCIEAAKGVRTGVITIHCAQCGDEIPEKRRKAIIGTKYCLDCANSLERSGRFFNNG